MKFIMSQWRKDKKAVYFMILRLFLVPFDIMIGMGLDLYSAFFISHSNEWKKYLTPFIILIITNVLFCVSRKWLRINSIARVHTSILDRFINKIIDADYELFITKSEARINQSSEKIGEISQFGQQIYDFWFAFCRFIISLISILTIDWRMIFIIIPMYTVSTIMLKLNYDEMEKADKIKQKIWFKRGQELSETIEGFSDVRLNCTQESHRRSMLDENNKSFKQLLRKSKIQAKLSFTFSSLAGITALIVSIFSAIQINAGNIDPAVAIVLIGFAWGLCDPIDTVLDILSYISEVTAQLSEFQDIIDYQIPENHESIELKDFSSGIKFSGVGFKYKDSDTILKDINLFIKKGQKVGICGPSGGGKTTILKLLEKFYEPGSGKIEVDGIDLTDITADSFRRKLAVVSQDPHIFNDTIYNNIIYGNIRKVEYEEVIEVLKKVNLYDFVVNLKDGLETKVGPRGLKLSGGQKQRIVIARIFLKNPDIILLDEATSALDNESDQAIQDALRLFKDKTIISVAHRLRTIKDSDVIYVINDHTVVESGKHDELITNGGEYAHLVQLDETIK